MNILVTGAWQGYQACKEELHKAGHETVFLQWEKNPLPVEAEWVEGIIGNGIFLSHPIEQFVNLKYIQLTSAGFDRVPMDYVKNHDIEIHNARGVYSIPMAEYALGGVLQLYKQYPVFAESQKKHEWNKIRSIREINGNTVCIVGCGSVGTECAKRFKAFGAQVVGVDLYPREDANYSFMKSLNDLDEILTDANIVVMTVPPTKETRNLINRNRMMLLKDGVTLVNMARGGVMDYEAFIDLKHEGRKLYAVLDVFDQEPLVADSPLWDMEGVIVTPHNSFVGNGNQERLNRVILQNLIN